MPAATLLPFSTIQRAAGDLANLADVGKWQVKAISRVAKAARHVARFALVAARLTN
jgi:hypothetical protein